MEVPTTPPESTSARLPEGTLTWVEVSSDALEQNVQALRAGLPEKTLLAPTVKANAYGHGLVESAWAFEAGGADWLCVNALYEAQALREADVTLPLYVMGYVPPEAIKWAFHYRVRMVIYDLAVLDAIEAAGPKFSRKLPVHVKVETGNHRQGLSAERALALCEAVSRSKWATLEGVASHFANVEDTTDHRYAESQLERFWSFKAKLSQAGIEAPLWHIGNSAASMLWPEKIGNLVRPGIASYGMWPSNETFVAAVLAGKHDIKLQAALRWTTEVAQVKTVDEGAFIGYGCTHRTTHKTTIAVLPVGYYDGYDRGLSNLAHVLIHGRRAPVLGRVCMNMIMVDVTDIGGVKAGTKATLLGPDGEECVTAEQMAGWANTINYEVTTRINERIPRLLV